MTETNELEICTPRRLLRVVITLVERLRVGEAGGAKPTELSPGGRLRRPRPPPPPPPAPPPPPRARARAPARRGAFALRGVPAAAASFASCARRRLLRRRRRRDRRRRSHHLRVWCSAVALVGLREQPHAVCAVSARAPPPRRLALRVALVAEARNLRCAAIWARRRGVTVRHARSAPAAPARAISAPRSSAPPSRARAPAWQRALALERLAHPGVLLSLVSVGAAACTFGLLTIAEPRGRRAASTASRPRRCRRARRTRASRSASCASES